MIETDDHVLAFGVTKKEFVETLFSLAKGVSSEEEQQSALQRADAYESKAHQRMSQGSLRRLEKTK